MPRPRLVHFPRAHAPLHVCAALASPRDRIGHWMPPAFGAGRSAADAAARATAEWHERRAATWRGDEATVRAAWSAVAERAVAPNALLLHSARQAAAAGLALAPAARRVRWVAARRLAADGARLVPAHLVYFRARGGPGRADSSGCALGTSRADATARALLELIERDAVALWWYHRIARPRVPERALADPLSQRILGWLDATGRDTWVLDLTSDLGVPVAAAVSIRRGAGAPQMLLGFGARATGREAVRRALVELAQEEAIVRATDAGAWSQLRADRQWLRHATVAAHPWLAPRRPRPSDATRMPTLAAGARSATRLVGALTRRLVRAGLDPLVVDLTRDDTPGCAVRALVPGLRPWWPRFAPGRLFDAPIRAGWCRRVGDEFSLNPFAIWF